ncbi:unnamed protein product [Discosporangium mesarthrocarpum]
MSWADWAGMGYGPLQWMSHSQKALLGELALGWVAFRTGAVLGEGVHEVDKEPSGGANCLGGGGLQAMQGEAVLRLQPVLACVVRCVEGLTEDEGGLKRDRGIAGKERHGGKEGGGEGLRTQRSSGTACVVVRDEGMRHRVTVFRGEGGGRGVCGSDVTEESKRGEGGRVDRILETKFGKESWGETGHSDLLWVKPEKRRYLAHWLAHQVFVGGGGGGSQIKVEMETQELLVSQSPLLFWEGKVTVPRLGDPFSGVLLSVLDAGQTGVVVKARLGNGSEAEELVTSATIQKGIWTCGYTSGC